MNNKHQSFSALVKSRHSPRDFLSDPLSKKQIETVLHDAQHAPSNCNTQPWVVHIVSGEKKQKLSEILIDKYRKDELTLDFSFDVNEFHGVYAERRFEQGKAYYEALGISRYDEERRTKGFLRNLEFFGAPHVAFMFMPTVGDNVRVASDVGMYAQNFLLSLTAHGYAGIPQTILGFFAQTVRDYLSIPDNYKLLFGISFGYENVDAVSNKIRMGRANIAECVTFHE
ncbi:nitroreductase family protein [Tolumonas osonensis]|uniref:Nitroreductase n=1 Tax=Tolumonas osonensis TaxID=675874 RepID=A0A841GRE2_9GAMM|nr:nitroreductase [Tolumonas osonensis]